MQSFKVLMMSYRRPLWSAQCIWSNVWAGLNELSTVTLAFFNFDISGLRAWERISLSDNSYPNSSSATSGEREEIPWGHSYSVPASWSSQLIHDSPKTACNCSSAHLVASLCVESPWIEILDVNEKTIKFHLEWLLHLKKNQQITIIIIISSNQSEWGQQFSPINSSQFPDFFDTYSIFYFQMPRKNNYLVSKSGKKILKTEHGESRKKWRIGTKKYCTIDIRELKSIS